MNSRTGDPGGEGGRWATAAVWLLGFGLVFFLAVNGGGYDTVISSEIGILIWWVSILGILTGLITVRKLGKLSWIALGLLAAFVSWVALGLLWTESEERTLREVARGLTYLGVFGLALSIRPPDSSRQIVTAIAWAVTAVVLIALASRFFPGLFPEARDSALLLNDSNRLGFPINYWNGLASVIAIGVPSCVLVSTSAKHALTRAVMSGLIPAILLAVVLTYSRTGFIAILIGLFVFFLFSSDRIGKVLTVMPAFAAGGLLVFMAFRQDAFEAGLSGPVAAEQGLEMLLVTVAVGVVTGGLSLYISRSLDRRRPRALTPTRGESRLLLTVVVGLVVAGSVALAASGVVSEGWSEFKQGDDPGDSVERLQSVAGNGRYQYWETALHQFSSEPVKGTGAGTFEFWWARERDIAGFVKDTHSVYLQTLGETGLIGAILLLSLVGLILGGGVYRLARSDQPERDLLAAALGGAAAFSFGAALDWLWQITVIPILFLLLSSILLSKERAIVLHSLSWKARLPLAALGVSVMVLIALPLASSTLVRGSQEAAAQGDLQKALDSTRSASLLHPDSMTPYLQEALVLELSGNLKEASKAAREAKEREPTNWRPWLILSRIDAERGRKVLSRRALKEARRLNPLGNLYLP